MNNLTEFKISPTPYTPTNILNAIEKMRRDMVRELGVPPLRTPGAYLVFVAHRMEVFNAGEMQRIAEGTWMPDFLTDFRRWFAATCVRHGVEEKILAVQTQEFDRAWIQPTLMLGRSTD